MLKFKTKKLNFSSIKFLLYNALPLLNKIFHKKILPLNSLYPIAW
jgi:hypothetical protein